MQWVWEELSFRNRRFQVAHFEAPKCEGDEDNKAPSRRPSCNSEREFLDDPDTIALDRCEAELGACLWHDTNFAALRFLEARRSDYMGVRMLELGAGPGPLGLALALDGADAVVTDLEALVPLLELNVRRNGFATAQNRSSAKPSQVAAKRRAGGRKGRKQRDGGDASSGEEFTSNAAVHAEAGDGATRRGGGRKGRRRQEVDDASSGDERVTQAEPIDIDNDAAGKVKVSAKERRAKRAAAKELRVQSGQDTKASLQSGSQISGRCVAQAADWHREAEEPTLPACSFELVVICDCLYENTDSWEALRSVLYRVLAMQGAEVVLASATLRRPYLKAFAEILEDEGYTCVTEVVGEHAEIRSLRPPERVELLIGGDAVDTAEALDPEEPVSPTAPQ